MIATDDLETGRNYRVVKRDLETGNEHQFTIQFVGAGPDGCCAVNELDEATGEWFAAMLHYAEPGFKFEYEEIATS